MVKVVYGTGDQLRDLVVAVYKASPINWMGPLYIGACVDFFFLGILFSQTRFYYSKFPRDTSWIKRLVGLIFILSFAKACVSFVTIWDVNIVSFGDWRICGVPTWSMMAEPTTQVVVSIVAQLFFIWRVFTLTGRNWYLLAVLVALLLIAIASAVAQTIYLVFDPGYIPTILITSIPMLISGLVVDVVITAVVSYKLIKSRGGFIHRTEKAVSQMLAITWESAAPPALSQVLNVILFITTLRFSVWSSLFNMLTPRLYVFSLLHTLNARAAVRSTLDQETSVWPQQGLTGQPTRKGNNTGDLHLPSAVGEKK